MSLVSKIKRWRFPIVFGTILGSFVAAFNYRHYFWPEVEEIRYQQAVEFREKKQEFKESMQKANEERRRKLEAKKSEA